MTAEVAILNKTAIAVAADSAVTVGETKVHRSTTKIFSLCHDIGATIYGYSELGGMPWEVLLKLFRAEHGRDPFPTVDACYRALHAFLSEHRFRLENGSVEGLIRFSIEVIEFTKEGLGEVPKDSRTTDQLTAIINSELESYEALDRAFEFDSPTLTTFTSEAQDIIEAVAESVFADIDYHPPAEVLPKFVELVFTALSSSYVSDYASGLVVFGFGHEELFPQLKETIYDCVPLGVLRRTFTRTTDAQTNGATIAPLADRTIMDTLIQGTDDHLHSLFVEVASKIATGVAERIVKDNLAKSDHIVAIDIAKRQIGKIIENLRESANEYIQVMYVNGMMNTIENMPKEDVAILAEALVEVTALRIKASEMVESVAGPVDVCVITKGEGLIWIKRKHYFDLSKNLQYLHRRYGVLPVVPHEGNNDTR